MHAIVGASRNTNDSITGAVREGTRAAFVPTECPPVWSGANQIYGASGTFRMRVPSRLEYPNRPPSKKTTWLRV